MYNQSVETRLLEYGEKVKEKQLQKAQEAHSSYSFTPQLETASSYHFDETQRGGNVSERLYNIAIKNRHENLEMRYLEESIAGFQRDSVTGQRLYEPMIDPLSDSLASKQRDSSVPVEVWLNNKGILYNKRAQMRQAKLDLEQSIMSETKKINPYSEKIVRDKQMYNGETHEDRLKMPIGKVKPSVMKTIERHSFQPTINEKSKEMGKNCGMPVQLQQQLQQQQQQQRPSSQYNHQRLPHHYSNETSVFYPESTATLQNANMVGLANGEFHLDIEDGVYSLHPDFGSPGQQSSVNNVYAQPSDQDNINSVYTRSQHWNKRKEDRLEAERKLMEKQMVEVCSFKPKLAENGAFFNQTAKTFSIDFPERHIEWLKKRDQRVESERKRREEEQMKECSFIPNNKYVTDGKGKSKSNIANESSPTASIVSSTSNNSYNSGLNSPVGKKGGNNKSQGLANKDKNNNYFSAATLKNVEYNDSTMDGFDMSFTFQDESASREYYAGGGEASGTGTNSSSSYIDHSRDGLGIPSIPKPKIAVGVERDRGGGAAIAIGKKSNAITTSEERAILKNNGWLDGENSPTRSSSDSSHNFSDSNNIGIPPPPSQFPGYNDHDISKFPPPPPPASSNRSLYEFKAYNNSTHGRSTTFGNISNLSLPSPEELSLSASALRPLAKIPSMSSDSDPAPLRERRFSATDASSTSTTAGYSFSDPNRLVDMPAPTYNPLANSQTYRNQKSSPSSPIYSTPLHSAHSTGGNFYTTGRNVQQNQILNQAQSTLFKTQFNEIFLGEMGQEEQHYDDPMGNSVLSLMDIANGSIDLQ